uniref:Protein zer-1 homolog-like C-terminal domain-containing protein n=1 Tax=Oncorhynchus tshawytscha TaxID=74940 RepID=A0A8C8M0M7_ONCTS
MVGMVFFGLQASPIFSKHNDGHYGQTVLFLFHQTRGQKVQSLSPCAVANHSMAFLWRFWSSGFFLAEWPFRLCRYRTHFTMDIDTFVPVKMPEETRSFAVVLSLICVFVTKECSSLGDRMRLLPEWYDGCVVPWCLYLRTIVCTDERGTFRRLEIAPKDEPDLWRSWLISFDFPMMSSKEALSLKHLDISDDKQFTSDVARQLLGEPGILPALVSLDVSGRKQVTDAAVKAFVEERPGMTFVGLLATDAGFSNFLNGKGSLKVTGEANETQICEALRRYSEREGFVREALFHLFSLTHVMEKPRPDILKLVVLGMKNHPATLNVQLAASACVFNLTKQDLAAGIPVRLLGTVTQLLLEAMCTFPNHQQLQKNCLLSLCSDRILQEVPFNRFEAAKLVMQWLCNHEDQNMQRMAVAIISILAAKLSTEQTAQLGAELFIVKQLLHIVHQKATQGVVDATLKFTLSALWNLTDESPTTCRHFIENQGLDLFIKVLESFPSESSIQQKVLGLLNNIAEVGELHVELMVQGFLDHICSLLHSPEVEVSYFAAGILAHLTSRGEAAWTLSITLRSDLLEQLHSTILKWPTPVCEMVAYRSFNPFFPLLECFHTPGVQLWAAWAMQHVCSKNAPRYCSMLLEEGGLHQLEKVQTHPDTHADVMRLAESILESLQRHQARTRQTTQTHTHTRCPLQPHTHKEGDKP